MSTAPFELRVWLRLLGCAGVMEARVRGGLRRRFGSTLPRFDLLAQLDRAGRDGQDGLTMSELSRRLMVSNGNLTGLAERLVREGLVSRTTPRDDRRAQVLRLTTTGRRALAAMMPVHHAWIGAMFGGMTESELRTLHDLLGKLRASAEAVTADDLAPAMEAAAEEVTA